jgi:uncharacterized membrane-anchored protein
MKVFYEPPIADRVRKILRDAAANNQTIQMIYITKTEYGELMESLHFKSSINKYNINFTQDVTAVKVGILYDIPIYVVKDDKDARD